jgi:hypothetical protein
LAPAGLDGADIVEQLLYVNVVGVACDVVSFLMCFVGDGRVMLSHQVRLICSRESDVVGNKWKEPDRSQGCFNAQDNGQSFWCVRYRL